MLLFEGFDELVTLQGARKKQGRRIVEADLSIITKGVLVVDAKTRKIVFTGKRKDLPKALRTKIRKEIHLPNASVLPGLIECHTHSLFGGNRVDEFEARNRGASYQTIAKNGGGILSTLRHTRESSTAQLKTNLIQRLQAFAAQGVTCVEVKTGYALDEVHELRQLKLLHSFSGPQAVAKPFAKSGARKHPGLPEVVSTYLGAHAVPPEFSDSESYIDFMTAKMFPQIRKWTKRVDIFVEKGFFTREQATRYATKAQELGLDLTVHADQLSLSGGAALAMEMGARSADHLIQIDADTIQRLAKSEVTCVGLPLADLYMKCSYPPLRALCDAGARVAIATDYNPGTAPSQDVTLTGLLARLQTGMTLPETLSAYTVASSFALGLEDRKGCLEIGYDADFFSTDLSWKELFYSPGISFTSQVFRGGSVIYKKV